MAKQSLRKLGLERRAALTAAERLAAGQRIQEALLALPQYRAAKSIALYAAVREEVATDLVISQALADGKAVYLPAVVGATLEFRQIAGLNDLQPGRFGIPEPPAGGPVGQPEEIDLFVVPGAVFDETGQRIGYGRGYYDKALHRLETSGRLLAFCFDCQLVPEFVGEPHDVRMDLIITERRVVSSALRK